MNKKKANDDEKGHRMILTLDDLTDLNRYAKDLSDNYIRASFSEKGDLAILCYTSKTQFSGYWVANTTLISRGLVIKPNDITTLSSAIQKGKTDDIAEALAGSSIVARGMKKFFTVEAANSDYGKLKLIDDDENITVSDDYEIDYDSPASVSDKLDGALGIGVISDNDIMIATKGSFSSDEAIIGTRMLKEKHDSNAFSRFMTKELPGYTPLFEIITPSFPHVVRYGDFEDVCFLGLMENSTGWWIPNAMLAYDKRTTSTSAYSIPERFSFRTPETYEKRTLMQALESSPIANREGMVVTIDDCDHVTDPDSSVLDKQTMFKIKYPMFLRLQSIKNTTSPNAIKKYLMEIPIERIIDDDNISLRDELPENVAGIANDIIDDKDKMISWYVSRIRDKAERCFSIFSSLSATEDLSTKDGAKHFAEAVNGDDRFDSVERSALFAMKSGYQKKTREGEHDTNDIMRYAELRCFDTVRRKILQQ